MDRWRGKWALVTGASAGIGWALAEELARGGTHLVLTARRKERLEELAAKLRSGHGINVEVIPADLARPIAPAEVFAFTEGRGIEVELLVNNAGFGAYGEFFRVPLERLLDMVQVNIAAVADLTHRYLGKMVERRRGDILILASTAAFQAVPYISTYAATKAFDLLLAEALAEEARPYGIHVCALCPGTTDSEFHDVAHHPRHARRNQEPADKVARVGLEALAAGKSMVISGGLNWFNVEAQRVAPRRLVTRVAASMFRPHAGE